MLFVCRWYIISTEKAVVSLIVLAPLAEPKSKAASARLFRASRISKYVWVLGMDYICEYKSYLLKMLAGMFNALFR